ncbi:MAG: DUF1549 and DUF1553 domain-containing protein [Rubripirellula sp.]
MSGVSLCLRMLILASISCIASPYALSEERKDERNGESGKDSLVESTLNEADIEPFDRDHWAYRPVLNPTIPDVQLKDWGRTSIDRFILARLEAKSLSPASEANRATLARRVSFDLTGLPPSSHMLSAFLQDERPNSYERLVDRLLASPQYARRWGQFWLDLARFAETDGYEHDKVRPNAWRYRDWVIDAWGQDIGYDEFITLQLAGDTVRPNDESASIATAFCLSGPDMPDINSQEERKHVLLNEVTSTVGSTLLSLQVGCAQCHDHKYDAISQADFYRLRAFFEPAVKLKTNRSVTTLDANADRDVVSHLFERGDWRRAGAILHAAFPRIANPASTPVRANSDVGQREQLANWLTHPSHPLTARSIVNRVWQQHFGSGLSTTPSDFGVMGQEPSHPLLLDHLASRLVNHDWSLKDLHRQIVRSSVYRTCSLQEQELPLASRANESWAKMREIDPDNRLLARFPRRRLDAEAIRDAMLSASDSLNHKAGGPGVSPPLPEELIRTLKKGQWKQSPRRADHYRRSIYIFARRNLRYPLFATFDRPAANCSCAVRHSSTTAVQSLLLLNSKITLDAAQRLARSVRSSETGRGDGRMQSTMSEQRAKSSAREVYLRVLSRQPSEAELKDCVQFLASQTQLLQKQGRADPEFDALADLCRAIFNSNPFLYVD